MSFVNLTEALSSVDKMMDHEFALSYSANTVDGLSQGNSLHFSFSHEKREDTSQCSVNADCNHWKFLQELTSPVSVLQKMN